MLRKCSTFGGKEYWVALRFKDSDNIWKNVIKMLFFDVGFVNY